MDDDGDDGFNDGLYGTVAAPATSSTGSAYAAAPAAARDRYGAMDDRDDELSDDDLFDLRGTMSGYPANTQALRELMDASLPEEQEDRVHRADSEQDRTDDEERHKNRMDDLSGAITGSDRFRALMAQRRGSEDVEEETQPAATPTSEAEEDSQPKVPLGDMQSDQIRDAMGLLIKHRGGGPFGAGRLEVGEVPQLEASLVNVLNVLRKTDFPEERGVSRGASSTAAPSADLAEPTKAMADLSETKAAPKPKSTSSTPRSSLKPSAGMSKTNKPTKSTATGPKPAEKKAPQKPVANVEAVKPKVTAKASNPSKKTTPPKPSGGSTTEKGAPAKPAVASGSQRDKTTKAKPPASSAAPSKRAKTAPAPKANGFGSSVTKKSPSARSKRASAPNATSSSSTTKAASPPAPKPNSVAGLKKAAAIAKSRPPSPAAPTTRTETRASSSRAPASPPPPARTAMAQNSTLSSTPVVDKKREANAPSASESLTVSEWLKASQSLKPMESKAAAAPELSSKAGKNRDLDSTTKKIMTSMGFNQTSGAPLEQTQNKAAPARVEPEHVSQAASSTAPPAGRTMRGPAKKMKSHKWSDWRKSRLHKRTSSD